MNNQYFILRHGQSLKNIENIAVCWPEKIYSPLTERGKKQINEVAKKIKKEKIDLIFSSDILRTRQTAEITGKELGLEPKLDKRLREVNIGILNGKPINEVAKEGICQGCGAFSDELNSIGGSLLCNVCAKEQRKV